MSEHEPLARPVVFAEPSGGVLAETVIEPGQDVRHRNYRRRRSYSQPRFAWLLPAASLAHE